MLLASPNTFGQAAIMSGREPEPMMSAELKLLTICCQLNFRRSVTGEAPELRDVDWDRFARLAAFHRVEGLAWSALGSSKHRLPARAAELLSAAAGAIAAKNLHSATECKRLLATFEAGNIPLLFLKGLALGALAYRSPFAKSAIDIDLLIDAADVDRAANLLRTAGYRLVTPHEVPLAAWHKRSKESVWAKESQGFQLDLHTKTADNARLIPSIDIHSPTQMVQVAAGIELPTLAADELIAYLTVHGASSAWFRLKWVSDFAALLDGCTGCEVERLYGRCRELGAGRAAGQALLVADRLFGTLNCCSALKNQLVNDRPIRQLVRTALRLLTQRPVEPTSTVWGTLPIHLTQLLLLPGFSYKISELSGQARRLLWRPRL
jgi:hypothetical protein